MKTKNLISKAINETSLNCIALACGVTYQAVRKWESKGRLPRTEWTGETDHASKIEEATGGTVSRGELLHLNGERSS
jgi:hypothetical protein